MTNIAYLGIYSDAAGCSYSEVKRVNLEPNQYAPPAPALNTSIPKPVENLVFLELPIDWRGNWHPTPVKQWLILMAGECEITTGDGKTNRIKAGDVVLLADTTGKGHQTKVIGNVPVRIAAIHYK